MASLRTHLVGLFILGTILGYASCVDKTLEGRSSGRDVVDAVVDKIRRAGFQDDSQFLRRVAYVETHDGTRNETYAQGNFGGIWNVNQTFYAETKNASLAREHRYIQSYFGIAWANTTWEDLLKPLYSGLAARLYFESLAIAGKPVPQKLNDQAQYWFNNFNSHVNWTAGNFLNETAEFDSGTVVCDGKMDLVAILDESGSVTQKNYDICKEFVANFFDSFSIEQVRMGLVRFSDNAKVEFGLDNLKPKAELVQIVRDLKYMTGATNTNASLIAASNTFLASEPRVGVPKITTIFTDGGSNRPKGVQAIELLEAMNVTTYVVGIFGGSDLNRTELAILSGNDPTKLFELTAFDVLTEFFKRLNEETCKTPQEPVIEEPVEDQLTRGQRRYYSLPVPAEGLTIDISVKDGDVMGYWSYTENNPNSAVHDGVLSVALGTFIPPPPAEPARLGVYATGVYVTIEGTQALNNYTLLAESGNFVATTAEPEVPGGPQTTVEPEVPGGPQTTVEPEVPGGPESTTQGSAAMNVNVMSILLAIAVSLFLKGQ